MIRRLSLLLVACCGVAFAERPTLLVFAAASMTDALGEIAKGVGDPHVEFSFGASSDLARQIAAGAPADVFVSADVKRMDEVEKAGRVQAAERRNILSNVLAVIVPSDATKAPATVEDLAKVEKLALADPAAVPAGVYAREWLTKRGLWDAVSRHVIPTADVRAALAAVETGAVDAGVVYKTDAATSTRVKVAFEVPATDAPAITYVAAPIADGKHLDAARAFVRRLSSPEAAAVFRRLGFVVLSGS